MNSVSGWVCALTLAAAIACAAVPTAFAARPSRREVNAVSAPEGTPPVAIVNATLIDGRGGPPVPGSTVMVRRERIVAAGPRGRVRVPADAEVVDGSGLTLLPGLIDSHFHVGDDFGLPRLFLEHG